MNPAILFCYKSLGIHYVGTPAFPIEGRQGNASPPQPFISNRLSRLHPHDHRGTFLDFSNLAELDVLGETGHECWAEADASQVTGAESWEEKEEHPAKKDGACGHAQRRDAQRPIEFAV